MPQTDEQFIAMARRIARRRVPLGPYRDGEHPTPIKILHKISDDLDTQVFYSEMRLRGESHSMAEMLATRSFPGVKTDAVFNEGRCNGNQFEKCPAEGDYLRRLAEDAGVSTTGKMYYKGLASYPGDPEAWASDRGDVLRIAKAKGLSIIDGYVSYQAPTPDPGPEVAIAPDLISDEVDDIMADEGSHGLRRADVEERLTALRSGAIDPNPLLVSDPVGEL